MTKEKTNNIMGLKVLLCGVGEKEPNRFVINRNQVLLRYALEERGIEYTYDLNEKCDLVHLLSLSQIKAYLQYRKLKNIPAVFTAFLSQADLEYMKSNEVYFDVSKISKFSADISKVIVYFPCQELIFNHHQKGGDVALASIGGKYYPTSNYSKVEIDAFRKYYKIEKDRKIIFSYGEYVFSKGIDTLEAVARIMPEYEFFFFGGKSGVLSNARHYEKGNNIANLHYEDDIHRELYHSLLMNATALFIPYEYHVDTCLILEAMKANVAIVSNKNPFLFDLLIKDKTALIGESVEDFYNILKNVSEVNHTKEAFEYASKFTPSRYGEELEKIYLSVLNK